MSKEEMTREGDVEAAAEAVFRTMRALDAHRHESAPTLERAYQRALEAYFIVGERAAGRALLEENEREALDEEERAGDLRNDRTAIAGHYVAARRALRLARAYGAEPGSSGRRERESVATALRHREAIRAIRMRMVPQAEQLALPGLAKTRPGVLPGRIVRSA